MDPARRSVVMLAVLLLAMLAFAVFYWLSGAAAPDATPLPSTS